MRWNRISPRGRSGRGREERGQLLVVDLVHSGPQRWRASTPNSRGGTGQGERLLNADTVSALLHAGKKVKSPRIRIEIEVPEVHLDARLFVHGLCIRGCREARGGKHRDLDRAEISMGRRERDAIGRLMFRLLRMQGAPWVELLAPRVARAAQFARRRRRPELSTTASSEVLSENSGIPKDRINLL